MSKTTISVLSIVALVTGYAAATGLYQHADAKGEAAKAAELDAGIAAAPSVEVTAPVIVVAVPSDAIADPVKEPAAAFDDVKAARKTGWTLALLVVLIMALRGLGYFKGLSFFKKDRVAIVVAGALTVATSLFDTLILGGTWVAALYAAAGALAIYWRSKHAVVAPAAGST